MFLYIAVGYSSVTNPVSACACIWISKSCIQFRPCSKSEHLVENRENENNHSQHGRTCPSHHQASNKGNGSNAINFTSIWSNHVSELEHDQPSTQKRVTCHPEFCWQEWAFDWSGNSYFVSIHVSPTKSICYIYIARTSFIWSAKLILIFLCVCRYIAHLVTVTINLAMLVAALGMFPLPDGIWSKIRHSSISVFDTDSKFNTKLTG